MINTSGLPKWAQSHIQTLEMRNRELTNTVRELSEPDSITETDTVVHTYLDTPDFRLPKGSLIRFDVNGSEMEVRVERGVLEVRANNGTLSVAPRVSNVVEIEVKTR